MSEYIREEILKLIEVHGGPEGLDLSGKDLSGIDLSREAIQTERVRLWWVRPRIKPVWLSELTDGIDLEGARLEFANLPEACLTGANLQRASLREANLQKVDLREAKLQRALLFGADLRETKLQEADLQEACLMGANLQEAELRRANLQEADLESINLQGADLKMVNLQDADLVRADLQRAKLMFANLQRADLRGANLQEARLLNAKLQGADLGSANLQGADLGGANLQGGKLGEANLKRAVLRYSHLEKVDFFGAETLEGAYFYNAFLDDTRMRREQLGGAIGEEKSRQYDKAKEAYLALKNNFAEIGRYRDESWAYVKERQMGRMMYHPRLARKYYANELPENPDAWRLWRFYIRHTAKWALDWIVEWTCGYGENVLKTLRAMGVALGIFAVLYWLLGAVVDVNGNPSSSWLHFLLYSGGAFTTFGVDTLRPANDWIRALSILESVVGIALTGLLGFVLGNRIRRS